jgi:hypothetical protein
MWPKKPTPEPPPVVFAMAVGTDGKVAALVRTMSRSPHA